MHFTEFLLLEGQLSGHFVGFYLKKEYNNEMLSQGFFFFNFTCWLVVRKYFTKSDFEV